VVGGTGWHEGELSGFFWGGTLYCGGWHGVTRGCELSGLVHRGYIAIVVARGGVWVCGGVVVAYFMLCA
jgi:hypothetical protein